MSDDFIPLVTEKQRRGDADPPEDEDKEAKSQREKLDKAAGSAKLWNDGDEGYASVPISRHFEHYAIRSTSFRRWLIHQYYLRFRDAPGRQQVEDALGLLSARAISEGERHTPVHRVAGDGNRIWIDLCDDEWRTIEITRAGWDVVRDAPAKFIRRQGMRALPEPNHDGDITELKDFLHLSEEHFMLAVAWLLGALRPGGQYPILTINGEQGGGKSTACRMFRRLVDPHAVEIRSPPGNQRDLVADARHNWLVSLDKLSSIPDWLCDPLCRIATGGGVGGRRLYSDDDEAVFEAKRPILLNGIPHLTERPDLADRVLAVQVYEIPADKRRDDDSLWASFDAAHPRILGGICDVLAAALAQYDAVKLVRAPRMASFARWITAAEPALGWSAGSFIEVYLDNRADAVRITVEADLVAAAVRDFASEKAWEGTAGELLSALNEHQPETTIKTKDWPKTAHHFSGRLRRVAPDRRKLGVEVRELSRQGEDRRIKWKIGGISVRSVRSVQSVDFKDLSRTQVTGAKLRARKFIWGIHKAV